MSCHTDKSICCLLQLRSQLQRALDLFELLYSYVASYREHWTCLYNSQLLYSYVASYREHWTCLYNSQLLYSYVASYREHWTCLYNSQLLYSYVQQSTVGKNYCGYFQSSMKVSNTHSQLYSYMKIFIPAYITRLTFLVNGGYHLTW